MSDIFYEVLDCDCCGNMCSYTLQFRIEKALKFVKMWVDDDYGTMDDLMSGLERALTGEDK